MILNFHKSPEAEKYLYYLLIGAHVILQNRNPRVRQLQQHTHSLLGTEVPVLTD